jgi:radical SAM superfamily enzyme YgiQ (UPF0313 family)
MTDILLIQPPIRDFYLTAKRTIPYGLARIAAVLIDQGYSVDILDALTRKKSRPLALPEEMTYLQEYYGREDRSPFSLFHSFKHFGYGFEHIARAAGASGAFLVGISSLFTPYAKEAVTTAETVKALYPSCKIVMGGHHPTAMPETVMTSRGVDFVLRGEGEVSMPRLADIITDGGPLDSVPGIVYRKPDGDLAVHPPVEMTDPDIYPSPASHLIDHRFYRRGRKGGAVILASRGCPLKCSYCSIGNSSYLSHRRRSVESVLREIDDAVAQRNAGFIDFEDENLTLDRKWFLDLLNGITRRFGKNGPELRAMNGLYPPSLDKGVIRKMKEAGFKTLNLSLGSTAAGQLQRFNRPDVVKAFDRALTHSETYGMNTVGYIIVGAPFQSAESSISDLLFLAGRRVLAAVSVFYPAPGSVDFELCRKLNLLPEHLSCLRSSALPLSHTTTRLESATLLRLGRILNFIKSLTDKGITLADLAAGKTPTAIRNERIRTGIRLVQSFMDDGNIRGIAPDGSIFNHPISRPLVRTFIRGLESIRIRGS